MLLLSALALDLACVPVGIMVSAGADVVEGVVWLPADPEDDAVEDGEEEAKDNDADEDVKLLDPEVTLGVDECTPPRPVALEFVLVSDVMDELDDEFELWIEEDNDDDDGR